MPLPDPVPPSAVSRAGSRSRVPNDGESRGTPSATLLLQSRVGQHTAVLISDDLDEFNITDLRFSAADFSD